MKKLLLSSAIFVFFFCFIFLEINFLKILIVLLLLLTISKGRKQKLFFNPYYIFVSTIISYFLYSHSIGGIFLSDLGLDTQILIILCLYAVFCGFVTGEFLKVKAIISGNYTENFYFVFIVGVLPSLIAISLYGNTLDMSGEELLESKEKMSIPFFGQFAYWLPASIIIACKKNVSRWIVIATVASFIVALMSVTKTGMLIALMYLTIGLYIFNPDILKHRFVILIKKYSFIVLPVFIISFFIFNNSLRHEASSDLEMSYVEKSNSKVWSSTYEFGQGMFLNYLYYCSPWSNLDYNIRKQHKKGYGSNTVAQFAHLLRLPEHRVEKLNPTFLNTHSFITDYYIDFGFFGAVIASYVLGIFIFFCYRKFGCSDDPLLLSFYILVAFATFMLFFSNHFNQGYLLNYFITFVGYSSISRKLKLK